jgi:hypothetical protein
MIPIVAAVDVGSLANIGWWRSHGSVGDGGRDLDLLVAAIAADLDADRTVALGFEAPLFIPRPPNSAGLNKQRVGERGRPWCAGAGTGALALGMQQATYVLSAIARSTAGRPAVGFSVDALSSPGPSLVLWEAFVSGKAKNRLALDPHVDDARVAVAEFEARFAAGSIVSDIADEEVLNVAAAALLAAGLTDDVSLLTRPCIVVRAPDLPGALESAL